MLAKVARAKGQAGSEGLGMLCRGTGPLATWPIGCLTLIISPERLRTLPPFGQGASSSKISTLRKCHAPVRDQKRRRRRQILH